MKRKTGKKLLSFLLSLVMVIGLLPGGQILAVNGHNHTDAEGGEIAFQPWDGDASLPTGEGNYYLTKDVLLNSSWSVPAGTVNLCLNGHKIDGQRGTFDVVRVPGGSALNLYDCGTEEHRYTVTQNGVWGDATVELSNDGTASFTGGYITGSNIVHGDNYQVWAGSGVRVCGGKFTMYGGTIFDNKGRNGGGVFVESGSFDMRGGGIRANCAIGGAGNSSWGGGVLITTGTFTMYDGVIRDNYGENAGGGVFMNNDKAKFYMRGGEISNNVALAQSYGSPEGAGVYAWSGNFEMSGGRIVDNIAKTSGNKSCYGAGVFVGRASMSISGPSEIYDNKGVNNAGEVDSNVALNSGKLLSVTGLMENNTPIGVTKLENGNTYSAIFTSGLAGNIPEGKTVSDIFTSDNGLFDIKLVADGNAGLANEPLDYYVVSSDGRMVKAEEPVVFYNYLTGNERDLSEGWYAVKGEVSNKYGLKPSGTVHLILCDGAKLDTTSEYNGGISMSGGAKLYIYGQREGSGKLIANGAPTDSWGENYAGIACLEGSELYIHGGEIIATGGRNAAGIGGMDSWHEGNPNAGSITILGGSVTATGSEGSRGIGGANNGTNGTLTLGKNVSMTVSEDGSEWTDSTSDTSVRERYMKTEYVAVYSPVKGGIKVKKTLTGRDWNTEDSFTFTISASEGTPMPKNNTVTVTKDSADYTESFGEITFTMPGTYTYTISETHKGEEIDGVSYDSEDKTVTIKIKDDGSGTLVADGTELVQTAIFENSYRASNCEGEIKVRKTLTGRDWNAEDSFAFTISAAKDTPMPKNNTITVNKDSADYTESFGKITFTKPGTYTYTISETHKGEKIDGVSYDSEDKTVTIKIKDDGKGKLVADGTALVQTATFVNSVREKLPQTAPAAPVVTATTVDSITVKTVRGVEFSIDGEHWQMTGTFTGLQPDTTYVIQARKPETENYSASPAAKTVVNTPAAQSQTGSTWRLGLRILNALNLINSARQTITSWNPWQVRTVWTPWWLRR